MTPIEELRHNLGLIALGVSIFFIGITYPKANIDPHPVLENWQLIIEVNEGEVIQPYIISGFLMADSCLTAGYNIGVMLLKKGMVFKFTCIRK